MPHKIKIVILILFFVSGSSYFSYAILKSLFNENAYSPLITPVKKPAYVFPFNDDFVNKAFISEDEYKHLQNIKYYMDSLKKAGKGKTQYDSIISRNPALLEDIKVIEKLYQSQTKK